MQDHTFKVGDIVRVPDKLDRDYHFKFSGVLDPSKIRSLEGKTLEVASIARKGKCLGFTIDGRGNPAYIDTTAFVKREIKIDYVRR